MSIQDIKDYEELSEIMRQNLEDQYMYQMMSGDKVGAHETLKRLMAYQLVDKDDPRCSVSFKGFAPDVNVKESSSWGNYDYRRKNKTSTIPQFLFCDLRYYGTFDVPTYPHWGKRVEGNYEGDVYISANTRSLRMQLANTEIATRNYLEEVGKIFKANGSSIGATDVMLMELAHGVTRIYNIEITNNVIYQYKNVGCVMIRMGDTGKLQAKVAIRYNALKNTWTNIKEFVGQLNQTIAFCTLPDIEIGYIWGPEKALQEQEAMLKADNAMSERQKKVAERTAAIEKAKKEAKEASANEKAAKVTKKATKSNSNKQ